MKHRMMNRLIPLLICFSLILSAFPAHTETLKSAPLTHGNTQNGMVRVRLASLSGYSTLNLTICGSYTVNGNTSRELKNGAKATVTFNQSAGSLSLTVGGQTTNMGASFKLRRHETTGDNGIKIAQSRSANNLYPGDFTFTVQGSAGAYSLYVIACIYMEDYLYGVVPYEMGNSSGLEALKAQAVAARTYTMRAMSAASSSLYDVVDTTADQVYSGTPSGGENCKAAVDLTRGIVLKNGNAFTATYYTASNGGQTESIKNAWGSSGYAYLTVKDDPYDLANPDSRKQSFTVNASGAQSNAALGSLLNAKAASQFGDGASIIAVSNVYAHTPKYPEPSRLYTKLSFDVTYTRGGVSGSGTLTFDIFGELESALNMSVSSGSNELWSVLQTDSGFIVTARRYGHGIGMSQRGAMYMDKLGYAYDQILAFYFEGCTRVQYTLTRSILSPVVAGQPSQEQVIAEQPADLPDPSAPAATPVPAVAYAQVNTPRSSLNLRKTASDSAKVLLSIPKGEIIPILEKGNTWCKTVYGGYTGYVMTKYLGFTSATAVPTASPAPDPGVTDAPATLYARVTTASGSLNLRAAAKSTGRILRTIPQNEIIPILERGSSWCKTEYGGYTGYVMTSFLTFLSDVSLTAAPTDPAVTPAPTAAAIVSATPTVAPVLTTSPTAAPAVQYARVTTVTGSLNLRSAAKSTARVLCTIPQYQTVTVLNYGASWCQVTYNGVTGYVMTKFLTLLSDTPSAVPTSTPAPFATVQPTAAPDPAFAQARVTTSNGSLNLRVSAKDTARVLLTIPKGETISVLNYGVSWCLVTYSGATGYVMTKFLTFEADPFGGGQPTATPAPTAAPDASLPAEVTPLAQPVPGRVMSTGNSLNLRAGCSTQALILLEIPKYADVVITAVGENWCAVEYQGIGGYCMTKYLEFTLDGQ